MKKRIILGLPKSFSMFESIKTNLEFYGFEVISVCFTEHEFKYKNFSQRAYNFFRKTFLNDKTYKGKLKFEKSKVEIDKIIDSIEGKVDYCLLIRADIYPIDTLQKLKRKSNKFIAYQWDGLHRFPAIYNYIPLFDRFFVFDKNDLNNKKYNLLPVTNFYNDFDTQIIPQALCKNDVFFIGSFINKRMPQIERFVSYSEKLGLKLDFIIFSSHLPDQEKYDIKGIKYINKHLPYSENLKRLKNAKIVIDFLNETHVGLSFRTFEALYYDKKLITNNIEVLKYDFYKPENIFIWDGYNLEGLEDFINTPYAAVEKEIKLKYGFKNWLAYVLGNENHTPIELP